MKYFTNNTFSGAQPTGTSAIIKARTKEHAAEVLSAELRKRGVPQREPLRPDDMILWPLRGEQVRILNDGDG